MKGAADMMTVFTVNLYTDDAYTNRIDIGIYSTVEKAISAVETDIAEYQYTIRARFKYNDKKWKYFTDAGAYEIVSVEVK